MHTDKIWKIIDNKKVFSCKIYNIYEKKCYLPSKNINNDFFSININDWVNIFAVTDENKLLLVKQHRLGKELVTLEVPAGAIDTGENPVDAAKRELLEETGYTSDEVILLKAISVNPALQDNICYAFLAKNCKKTNETDFDNTEELDLVIKDLDEVYKLMESDTFDNTITFLTLLLGKNYMENS